MASLVLGNPFLSGAIQVIAGNPWSGQLVPVGGIQLKWVCPASGALAYVSLSGGGPPLSGGFMTYNSGTMMLSGGFTSGALDGIPMGPGESMFIPKIGFRTSGAFNLYANCDPAASGIGRLFFEIY